MKRAVYPGGTWRRKGAEEKKAQVYAWRQEHPMVEAHYIQWIAIETTRGGHRVKLEYTDKPRAEFKLADGEEFVAAYEYCNIHGSSTKCRCIGLIKRIHK